MQKAISRRRFLKQATLAGGAALLTGTAGAAKPSTHGNHGTPHPYKPSRKEVAEAFRRQADYGEVTREFLLADAAQVIHVSEEIQDYLAAETRVAWDVDTHSPDVVRVYRATEPDAPTVYRRGDVAEAELAVPGWTMRVDELFGRPMQTC